MNKRTKRPIAVLLGTRPEIIKLAPVIRRLRESKTKYFLIHTGQHYSFEMDRVFFGDLGLEEPRYKLGIRSDALNGHGHHTGRMMEAVEKILLSEKPRALLVQGDTNSVLAGALSAAKIPGVALGHIEAGLRSYDRQMPEEINRVVADHVSDLLFAPTGQARKILLGEGIPNDRIFVTGNTIVDAVLENLEIAERRADKSQKKGEDGPYFLMTLHRQENVDNRARLGSIFRGIEWVSREFRVPVIFPIHPRTAKRLHEFGLEVPAGIRLVRPVGFLRFLYLESRAGMILSDSGGLQEEACILKVPCVTLRTTTERPETVTAGANVVAGFDAESIRDAARRMSRRRRDWKNPFGDGSSAKRIVNIVAKQTI